MSITVADLLKLPSLRESRVVAGEGGLSRIVSSISVLEYADPGSFQEEMFHNNEFYGSEIVISGLISVKDDVEKQCQNIRRLSECGEVGLILYYVGIFLPRVDERLMRLADELNFTLIVMPENRMNLRYSEVICEVMEAIFKDHMQETSIVSELLDSVARLPEHKRTVDTAFKMLSDRIHASVVLTDGKRRILNEAAWPRGMGGRLYEGLFQCSQPELGGEPVTYPYVPDCLLYRYPISSRQTSGLELYLLKEKGPLSAELLKQTVELVQLAVNIWGQHQPEEVMTELVRAIMQDEPLKMRRLAGMFHIDVVSIHSMWIIQNEQLDERGRGLSMLEAVRDFLEPYCRTVVADLYEQSLVVLMDGPVSLAEEESLSNLLLERLETLYGGKTVLTMGNHLKDTAEVRRAYLANQQYLKDAGKIYPVRRIFGMAELRFAEECRKMIEMGEETIRFHTDVTAGIYQMADGPELCRTLGVYLLDAGAGVTRTAELLYLHKNTVKYRLQKITDCLGCRVGRMPESFAVYYAMALERLLGSA